MAFGWFLLAVAYLALIFWLGRWGEKHSPLARKVTAHPLTYSLSLAIYCTAWTFFGAVGEAVRDQWNYLPILLGPTLLYVFGHPFLRKLIFISKKHHITTIADFIASRYGKRQTVALLVTLIALLATIPYIALQLKAIGLAFETVSGNTHSESIVTIATLFIALFCIYFGTQRTDVTEYRHGLMMAIAFESLVKLAALILMAAVIFFIWQLGDEFAILAPKAAAELESEAPAFMTSTFWMQTLLAMGAAVCLPRQFHVAILHNTKESHLTTARWVFPLYLILIAVAIPIIAQAGSTIFAQNDVSPDTYVLELALHSQSYGLSALVFLGGLSAATAMIIIATLTLSTMITNDVILPKLLDGVRSQEQSNVHLQKILWIRRGVIAGLLFFAYLYHQQLTTNTSLASIGLLAFSLVIQLLPAIIGGLYWKQAHAHGVYAGLLAGVFCWVLWLFIPLYNDVNVSPVNNEQINHAAMYSLFFNTVFYVLFSRLAKPRLIDKIQAQAFVDTQQKSMTPSQARPENVYNEDLLTVLDTFLGKDRRGQLVNSYEQNVNTLVAPQQTPTDDFIQFCERALGGVIGASSASILIDSVVSNQRMNFEQVIQVFDETTQALQMNQSALFASLGSLDQGISVIDKDLNLVAWNQAYLDMFAYPKGLVSFGIPIETLVRFNALRGECGVGEVEALVQKRLDHLHSGKPHKFVRQRSDGKVIEMVGNPLPQGGFVTSFNDITQHIELQQALKESNIDLEKLVQSRAAEVKAINHELRTEIERRAEIETQLIDARKIAETANLSKTRFLALASHDILQPLNAAKLYLAAIKESIPDGEVKVMIDKLDASLNASDNMIGTLLEIARLDQGEMQPKPKPIHLKKLLAPLIDEFNMKATTKKLNFATSVHDVWVHTDPTYLQRIVRNLLSNAIKYTNKGRAVFTVRRHYKNVVISVWDTGVGIAEHDLKKIFDDFYRINDSTARGVGLGLSVVNRLSEQIGSRISVTSELGKGSCFRFTLPTIAPQQISIAPKVTSTNGFTNLHVLCVDDEYENLEAMKTLLTRWDITVGTAATPAEALQSVDEKSPQVMLVDYQLGENINGIDLVSTLREHLGEEIPAVLVTAVRDESLTSKLQNLKIHFLAKPVKPAKLRALLMSLKSKK